MFRWLFVVVGGGGGGGGFFFFCLGGCMCVKYVNWVVEMLWLVLND